MFFGRCYMFYRFSTLPCGFFSFKLAQLCMCLPYWYDVRFAFCDIRAWIKVNTRYELSNHWLRLFRQFDVIFFALYAYVLRVCTPSIIQSRACFHVLILSVSMLLIAGFFDAWPATCMYSIHVFNVNPNNAWGHTGTVYFYRWRDVAAVDCIVVMLTSWGCFQSILMQKQLSWCDFSHNSMHTVYIVYFKYPVCTYMWVRTALFCKLNGCFMANLFTFF